jgi:hypothetical protein
MICDPRSPSTWPRRVLLSCIIAGMLAGCAGYRHDVAPLDPKVRQRIGQVEVELGPVQPLTNFGQPPSGKGKAALAAAGGSVAGGVYAGALTFNPYGLAFFTVLGIAVAPFAAAIGAIVTPSTEDVEAAGHDLAIAIRTTDWASQLKSSVEAAMRRRAEPPAATSTGQLGMWIEGPWLVLDGGSAIPTLTIHGELLVDGGCVVDRNWRWNGRSDDFVDLGENGARAYRAHMTSGVRELGNAIVADLFLATQARSVAYHDREAADRGAPPSMALVPDAHQNEIGSWDNAQGGSRCVGLLQTGYRAE